MEPSTSSPKSRKSYTILFKRQVLASLANLEGNVSATARKHLIPPKASELLGWQAGERG
jgi:transposase-like protein